MYQLNAREIHPAAEERHEHREKEIAEAALRPDQLPVHRICRRVAMERISLLSWGLRRATSTVEELRFRNKLAEREVNHRGKRSELRGAVRQATVRRESIARNERDSLPRRISSEDSLFHDQIGEAWMANSVCRQPKGSRLPTRCGRRKVVREIVSSQVAHRKSLA